MKLNPDEIPLFDMYLIGIVSMARAHPGANRDGKMPTLDDCITEVMNMIEERRKIVYQNYKPLSDIGPL